MNRSGDILRDVLKATGSSIDRLLVVCDTMDLQPGLCRLKRKGSSAGHKGLSSIISKLGTASFMRLYIGVGRPGNRKEVINYVLGDPRGDEAVLIEEALYTASECILKLLEEAPEKVMNVFNKKST